MTTIGFCSSSLPPSSFIGKRKRLAPPSKDVLPKSPSIFSSGDIGDGKDTAYHVSLLSLLQGRIFSTPSNTMKSPRRKSLDGPFPTEDDDDTASTVSVSTSSDSLDEEDDCDFSNRKSVSFSYPLVTKIHTRPTTTFEDKYYLHYSDLDYLDFKIGLPYMPIRHTIIKSGRKLPTLS